MRFLPIILIISISANLLLAWSLFRQQPSTLKTQQQEQTNYPYLSKRIFAEQQNDILINFIPLRTAMREYLAKQNDPIGVYFEYLPSGTSIGVNDNLEVILASLIKTPLVMGVYRQIEKGKLNKNDIITLRKEDLDEKFGDLWMKGQGHKLTVEEAIRYALVNSDNTAANALTQVVPETTIDTVFDSLDISTNKEGEVTLITPKGYSSIFRSLYLSSFLSQESSNEILDILTRTLFDNKIASGVPETIKVSHKIGVFNSLRSKEKAYSDCGIIYVPQRPYLLCIMTKSTDDEAHEYMQYLSKMVYGYITSVRGG